jgi:hypothetical protein
MPAYGYPSPPLVGGTTARAAIFENYVFQSGVHDPEYSKILTYKYPQYYMTTLLDKLGAAEPTAQSVFAWPIMDRTRKGATYTALANGTTPTATLTLDIAAASPNLGYFQVGDVIRVGKTGALGRVSAIGISGGFQTIDITRIDTSSSWTTGLLPAVTSADVIGHVFTQFGEGTNGPDGRVFLPVEDQNYTQIIKRSMKVTGSEMSNKTLLGDGKAWYWTVEEILMKEFARDRELLVMFGQAHPTAGTRGWSRGILDWVLNGGGVINTYAGSPGVTEADLQAHIEDLLIEGGSSEYLVLCGPRFLTRVMVALKDYAIAGAQNYGSLGNNMAGLDFAGYKFAGKTIYFAYYELFNDTAALPAVTASATAINFQDFSLWLDLSTDNAGQKLIKLRYKSHGGVQRKFVHKVIPGMMEFSSSGAEGGFASNSFDGVEVQLLSDIGVEFRLPNRHGILRAVS